MSSDVFPCLNCREIINLSMSNCQYCGVAIDPAAATAAAVLQDRVAEACNGASRLKLMSRAMLFTLLISFVPFIGFAAGWAFLFFLVAIPVLLIYWWVKFRGLQTSDPDFEKARGQLVGAVVLWVVNVVLWQGLALIGSIISGSLRL